MNERASASTIEAFVADTSTSPAVVVTAAPSTKPCTELSTRFVAMTAAIASDVPWPVNVLPPEDCALESAVERMTAAPVAATVRLAADIVASLTCAATALRTSLSTTTAPAPTDSDCVMFTPRGRIFVTGSGFQKPRSP